MPDESPLVGGLSAVALVEDSIRTSPRALGRCFFCSVQKTLFEPIGLRGRRHGGASPTYIMNMYSKHSRDIFRATPGPRLRFSSSPSGALLHPRPGP